jgi:hypothetical protein
MLFSMERNRFDAVRYYFDYDNGTRREGSRVVHDHNRWVVLFVWFGHRRSPGPD